MMNDDPTIQDGSGKYAGDRGNVYGYQTNGYGYIDGTGVSCGVQTNVFFRKGKGPGYGAAPGNGHVLRRRGFEGENSG